VPIPGFVGSGKGAELADKEGAAGAFAKGVLTTVLATPCSGPMLGPALTWAVSQPSHITYAGFACVGLGMASPYLLIGAFPKLIGFLPRPGVWMETFKHVMGFVLLGTVVFLLTLLPMSSVVPMVSLMIGLWAACWWIGRTPLTQPLSKKLKAYGQAGVFAAAVGYVSFDWLHGIMEARVDQFIARRIAAEGGTSRPVARNADELPWQPYSRELLEKLTAENKTVFVDFTADW
jgi:thiol:disulfide interchange protein DsbD